MDDEIIREFLVESYESLEQVDRDLVQLEHRPNDPGLLAAIFRAVHTIKGTSSFLGLSKLESVAHVGENLLSLLRDGVLELDEPKTSALLQLVDAIREMLAALEAGQGEGSGEYTELVDLLSQLQDDQPVAENPRDADGATEASSTTPADQLGGVLIEQGHVAPEDVAKAVLIQAEQSEDEGGVPKKLGRILVDETSASPKAVLDALRTQATRRTSSVADSTIRVPVSVLDQVMNLVGELVLARNQVLQTGAAQDNTAHQRLNLVTTELQEAVMKTRMQPIGSVWGKFPRVVRDLSIACGKQVRLETEGEDTELDKTLLEAVRDPLTHLVRNAVDHGLEPPEARTAAGKPAEGVLALRAYHESGQVNVEISDDGGGIDPERIRAKAVERGVLNHARAATMSEREILNLVFLPGFSTAKEVTNVSGRGVGMDVVRTNIEKIGGTIDIQSVRGEGTTIRVKIPLTLAIIPALMVACKEQRFAIPQVSLLELVRLSGEQIAAIEQVGGASVYRLRGNLLPLVRLSDVVGVKSAPNAESDVVNIVVLQASDRQFGLIVDDINDTEEIVVKPLSKHLKSVPVFSGATILGDGHVALILDILGIAEQAHVVSDQSEARKNQSLAEANEHSANTEPLLIFQAGAGRMAVPLSDVARLEEFSPEQIECCGKEQVVQYRQEILSLHSVETLLTGSRQTFDAADDRSIPVIVYSSQGQSVGLAVSEIVDVVEQRLDVTSKAKRLGVRCSAVVQGRVTEILDVPALLDRVQESWHA